ncbi:HNH endonuclease [Ilumatobacter sp.]|uniref:HNH endonuclease signature motif containing protein n=1 Tax=Ilumatobacter sp. TaxID=1967498 RepID=UPI003AF85A62
MDVAAVVERVREVSSVSGTVGSSASRSAIESAITASAEIKAWLAAADARLATALAAEVSFPEQTIADCTRESVRDAAKTRERADTLGKVPGFADALDAAAITAGHVDAITSKAKPLTDDQRTEYFDRVAGLVDVASAATVDEFRTRLAMEARATERDDGTERLERQRRKTGVRVWTDAEGMWRFDGRFDPLAGVELDARLEAAVQSLFAEAVPDTCPTDPVLEQQHLRALAFHRLVMDGGFAAVGRPARREIVVVVDADQPNGAGGPTIDWGIPVEIPTRLLAEMCAGDGGDAVAVHPVIVRNGVVLYAPGELDLGRSTRLANRAQRRALRAMYPTCAIPGCSVRYARCKLHHLTWWRHGGETDLSNLLPLCARHHSKVHDTGWDVRLGPNRELTVSFPDGTVRNTGPPSRRAA